MAKTIDAWGSEEIQADPELIKQFGLSTFSKKELAEQDHYLFERGLIVGHRDFKRIAEAIKNKKPFAIPTGIATSGPVHLGHKVDIDLFLYFKSLGAKCYFAIADIDGYCSRDKVKTLADAKEYAVETAAHLLAMGLSEEDIHVQSNYQAPYYALALELSKKITRNTFEGIYGHVDMGKVASNFLQYSDILHPQLPEFEGPMPTLTGIGLDQEPHARATRDIAKRLPYNFVPPSFIYFAHQGGLKEGKKMSASEPATAIFLLDDPKVAAKKIDRAVSGGRETLEEHREKGGIPENDRAYEILLFHHPDSAFVREVYDKYKSGEMLTGELKKIAKDFLTEFLTDHQKKYKKALPVAKKLVYG